MEDLFSYISQDTLAGRPFLSPLLPDSVCQSLDYKMTRNVQTKARRRLALRGDGGTSSPEGPECEWSQEQRWKLNQHRENSPSIMCLLCLSHLFKCLHLHSAKCYLRVVSWGTIIQSQFCRSMQTVTRQTDNVAPRETVPCPCVSGFCSQCHQLRFHQVSQTDPMGLCF